MRRIITWFCLILKAILAYTASYMMSEYKVPMVLTHIFRTQKEQEEIYGVGYKIASPHQFNRAADARLTDLGVEKANEVAKHVNEVFPYGDGMHKTVLVHDVGRGNHIHFQIKG
jgi:hypothetical protein